MAPEPLPARAMTRVLAGNALLKTFRDAWSDDFTRGGGVIVGLQWWGRPRCRPVSQLMMERVTATSLVPPDQPQCDVLIAHFNHQCEPSQSTETKVFAAKLATWGCRGSCPVARQRVRTSDAEADLRQMRRGFLGDWASKTGCRYIALAHTPTIGLKTILHSSRPRQRARRVDRNVRRLHLLGSEFRIRRPLLLSARATIRQAFGLEIGQPLREGRQQRTGPHGTLGNLAPVTDPCR